MDIETIYTGALLGASGGLIYTLKAFPEKIYNRVKRNLIYTVKIYQYDELFDMLEIYLADKYKSKYKDVEASISQVKENTPYENTNAGDEKKKEISYKQEETIFIIHYENKKIIIDKSKEKIDKATSVKDIYFRKYSLSGFQAKKQIDSLLKEAILFNEKKKEENIVKVTTNNCYGDWYSFRDIKVKTLEKTVISPDIKKNLIEDIDEFKNSEQWYINTGIPYKRGICLYGPPGTGKTTLALAIANYTKRKVHSLNLNCLEDDSRLNNLFSFMSDNCVLLIEDIDKIFSGRENVSDKAKITFSTLLNCLDGAFYRHGLITIITTNHIEKLDEALLRTGRIDLKIEVPIPSSKEVSEYLSIFYNIPNFIIEGDFKYKMSDIQEICIQNKNDINKTIEIIK